VIGETVSHYRVVERLGEGGMGSVYLAEDLRLQRRVALKMMRSDPAADVDAGARLLREARAASALSHPSIAVVYEVAEADAEVPFIAMEYVPGETLSRAASCDGVTLDQVLDWLTQVADALAEAHAGGIVHRDLKPSNVMVTGGGRVKVLDFGLAKRQPLPGNAESTWSRDRIAPGDAGLVGTLAYMAPEQALGEAVDGRADVFSLGAVFYELLAGAQAFPGRSAARVLAAVLREEPAPFESRFRDPRVPRIEALARRMLSKDPAGRPARMEDVSRELRTIREGAPVSTLGAEPAPPRSVAVLSFTNITHNGEDDWLGTGIAETVTADLRASPGLTVIARERVHESLRRLGSADSGDEGLAVRVGRELGARWVLAGGLQRAGGTIRLTARLVEISSATVVGTVKIDGPIEEIFALQDRIVRELGAALRTEPASAQRGAEETHVVEAYEAFARGVINVRLESYESLDRAALLFEKAIRLDPTYARAHLELGSAYAAKGDYLALPELYERSLTSLKHAIELSPGFARSWRELGSVLVSLGREDEGVAAIEHALSLDPEDAGALGTMGRALFIGRGQFREAAAYFDRALARNPDGGWYALQLAHCAALLREFDRGERAARRAIALQEASLSGQERVVIVGAHMRLGHLAALQERHADAIEQFERELAFQQRVDHALRGRISIELHMRLGASLLRSGKGSLARASLETARAAFEERLRMGADEPFTRYYAACAHALRGDADGAIASLERAAKMRPRFTLARARIEPEFESLATDARFLELIS
jgi:serine/threonine protein kinase/tetratricopeptide (TPR) repeat protein